MDEDGFVTKDEDIWLSIFLALITCPKNFGGLRAEELADKGLEEFKKRFRD